VLVVDDEPALREVLSLRLGTWGHQVRAAADVAEAARALREERPDLVLSDVVLPDASGLELLRLVKGHDPAIPVIMITAHGHVETAVEAMKAGAADFLTKPLAYEALRAQLDAVAEDQRQHRQAGEVLDALDRRPISHGLVGGSHAIRELLQLVKQLAATDASALLTGESGTGKEVVARAIHAQSARRDGPFIAVNAAAIPEGLIESEIFGHEVGAFTGATRSRPGCFELANGGTLLLDEIGEMPLSLQPKLLRILEDGRARRLGGSAELRFDVRVLAATNRPPDLAIREGRLREDLFYRLSVFEIPLPALRDRAGDTRLLARYFVRELARKHALPVAGIRDSACALLEAHSWPGNVRELRNAMERAVILAGTGWVEPHHLPAFLQAVAGGEEPVISLPAGTTWAQAEQELILRTLRRVGNNKAEAARQLGLDVKTIRTKLKAYGQAP
jgi:DNA-binding NtrC family response regulator